MINKFFGFKLGQTQKYTESGERIPVTMVKVEPMTVISPWQFGFGIKKHINKPLAGLLKKAGIQKNLRFLREIRGEKGEEGIEKGEAGSEIKITDVFKNGDKVSVTGISKGKGFAGVVKRHGFHGGPKTHGQSDRERAPGSIGQTTTPGRVYKGKRMAGKMGNERVTIKGLEVFDIDEEKKILYIKGLVPGNKNGVLEIVKIP